MTEPTGLQIEDLESPISGDTGAGTWPEPAAALWEESDASQWREADDVPGEESEAAPWDESESESPTLRRDSRGPDVRRLQIALGVAGHPIAVDGDFGARTLAAVRAFQARVGLDPDGVVGPATWGRLTGAGTDTGADTGTVSAGDTAASTTAGTAPDVALGTLELHAGKRTMSYPFTRDDLVWTAKVLVHEAGGRDDPDNAAVLWALFNRFALFTHRVFPTFTAFVRAYSTTLQPVLRSSGAAARHMHRPPSEFVRADGFYPGTTIPRGQLKRHLDIQRAPWSSVKASARDLAARALTGRLPNPGIGLASEFASTRIYFRQRHGRNPDAAEWRRFTTDLATRKRWRWIGDVPRLDQRKNAFFLDLRAAGLPPEAVRVVPPADREAVEPAFGFEAIADGAFGESEHDDWELGDVDGEPDGPPIQEPEAWFAEGADAVGDDVGGGHVLDDAEDEDVFEADEFTRHADFEALADHDDMLPAGAEVSPEPTFSVDGELESWMSALARIPARVRSALDTGDGSIAVRLLVGAGVRDENRLTNLVFHARHPELGGRSIRPDERSLAGEWLTIRNDLVRPVLRAAGPSRGTPVGTTPATGTARPRILSTGRLRRAWHDDECRDAAMVTVTVLGRRTPANARTVDAWAALDRELRRTGYVAERAWIYNCRDIAGTSSRSLHAYGLAVDIDPRWNPNRRTPDRRPVRFSASATPEGRLADVRRHAADTVFTNDQIAAVESIRTVDGHQVFGWGGRWRTTKDTMHFQINVTPDELARGMAH